MSIPKEPRQLMINLMYLVLTALLALNVSNEILNAFKTIRKSIVDSNAGTEARNSVVSSNFDKYIEMAKDPVKKLKLEQAKVLAAKVTELTNAAVANVEKHKKMIIDAAGGIDPETNEIKRISDLDAATRIMIEEGANGQQVLNEKESRGELLKSALETYKADLSTLIPIDDSIIVAPAPNKNEEFFKNLPMKLEVEKTEDNPDRKWAYGNFHMSPAIASVTMLDKYISDVRACETQALDDIWAKAFGEKLNKPRINTRVAPRPFDAYQIIVAADNNFVLPGEMYKAKIMLGTYNTKVKNLSIAAGGRNLQLNQDGIAEFNLPVGNEVGPKKFIVTAHFNDSALGNIDKKIEVQYFVGEASASIELEKMNVVYAGLENPITVAASGIQSNKIQLNPVGCNTVSVQGVGRYEVSVAESQIGKTVEIGMKGTLPDGTIKDLGAKKFRVKRVPAPYSIVGNLKPGNVGAGPFRVQPFIMAKLDDFPYDLKWNVLSYTIQATRKGQFLMDEKVSGGFLDDPRNPNKNVVDKLRQLKPGDVVYIENIKAEMVGGKAKIIRSLADLTYKLN